MNIPTESTLLRISLGVEPEFSSKIHSYLHLAADPYRFHSSSSPRLQMVKLTKSNLTHQIVKLTESNQELSRVKLTKFDPRQSGSILSPASATTMQRANVHRGCWRQRCWKRRNRWNSKFDEIVIPQNPTDSKDDSLFIYIYSEFEVDEIWIPQNPNNSSVDTLVSDLVINVNEIGKSEVFAVEVFDQVEDLAIFNQLYIIIKDFWTCPSPRPLIVTADYMVKWTDLNGFAWWLE